MTVEENVSRVRKAIAIDFDGCLCADAYPAIGQPNWDVINRAKRERQAGAGLILWTCREDRLLLDAVAACESWGLCFDAVNESLPDWIEAFKTRPRKVGATKKNIQCLLTEYTRTAKAPEPEPAPVPEADAAPPLEPEAQIPAAGQQQDEPSETAPPQTASPAVTRRPDGARGLFRLRCPACGGTFGTFLKEYQTTVECRCGHQIDLAAPLARYRFICPYCEKETWGLTNLEDPDITIRCKCGGDVELRWNPKAKEYQD